MLWANILGRKNYEDNINVNWLQYRSHVLIYQKLLIHSVYNISISLKSRYTLHHITQVHFYFHAPHFCIAVLCFQVLYFYITFQIVVLIFTVFWCYRFLGHLWTLHPLPLFYWKSEWYCHIFYFSQETLEQISKLYPCFMMFWNTDISLEWVL